MLVQDCGADRRRCSPTGGATTAKIEEGPRLCNSYMDVRGRKTERQTGGRKGNERDKKKKRKRKKKRRSPRVWVSVPAPL